MATEEPQPDPDVCRWRLNHDTNSLHGPLHRRYSYLNSVGFSMPAKWHYEDGFDFCPNCGKRIEVVEKKMDVE